MHEKVVGMEMCVRARERESRKHGEKGKKGKREVRVRRVCSWFPPRFSEFPKVEDIVPEFATTFRMFRSMLLGT